MCKRYPFIRILLKLVCLFNMVLILLIATLYVPIGYLIRLVSFKLSVHITTFFVYIFWSLVDFIFQLTFEISGTNTLKENTNYLVISNHTCASDFMIINNLFKSHKTMKDIKYVVKNELKFFIVFYQMIDLLGFISLNRNYMRDESKIRYRLNKLVQDNIPANIVIFPEGSRLSKKTLLESQNFCKQRNLRVFKNVLYPRFNGTRLIYNILKGSTINQMADITIKHTTERIPALWEILFTGIQGRIKYDVKTISLEKIDNIDDWLLNSFISKEEFINKLN